VSDLHVGKFTRDEDLERAVETVNERDSDLVLMTGDLIDLSLDDLDKGLAFARRMEGRYGRFSCEGNHDRIENGPVFVERVKTDGSVPLLRDESAHATIKGERVQLLGLSWNGTGENLRRDEDAFPILLAHHPHAAR
jgi:predicted MPP superfamily phosphohydrolase